MRWPAKVIEARKPSHGRAPRGAPQSGSLGLAHLHGNVFRRGRGRRLSGGGTARSIRAGALLAVGVVSYSGVLLSVTNIPGWANTVLLGAIWIATSLRTGVAAVLLVQKLRGREDADLVALESTHIWLIGWWLVVMVAFLA